MSVLCLLLTSYLIRFLHFVKKCQLLSGQCTCSRCQNFQFKSMSCMISNPSLFFYKPALLHAATTPKPTTSGSRLSSSSDRDHCHHIHRQGGREDWASSSNCRHRPLVRKFAKLVHTVFPRLDLRIDSNRESQGTAWEGVMKRKTCADIMTSARSEHP